MMRSRGPAHSTGYAAATGRDACDEQQASSKQQATSSARPTARSPKLRCRPVQSEEARDWARHEIWLSLFSAAAADVCWICWPAGPSPCARFPRYRDLRCAAFRPIPLGQTLIRHTVPRTACAHASRTALACCVLDVSTHGGSGRAPPAARIVTREIPGTLVRTSVVPSFASHVTCGRRVACTLHSNACVAEGFEACMQACRAT